eukprot:5814553-Amphidinium_carterae.3
MASVAFAGCTVCTRYFLTVHALSRVSKSILAQCRCEDKTGLQTQLKAQSWRLNALAVVSTILASSEHVTNAFAVCST